MCKTKWFEFTLIILSGLMLLFIIAPLLSMVINTSPVALFETAKETEVQQSIFLTLGVAFATTLFFSLLAVPLAYLLARKDFFGKRLILGLIDLPVVIPHTAAGIALLGLVSRNSMLGKAASSIGIDFIGTPLGIAIAMAFVSIPFLINAARNGFEAVPERLEKVALTLGASPTRMFWSISLPLASKSILSGMAMMFGRGMSEFGAVVILAYHPMVTPVMIFERFNTFGLEYARPLSLLFLIVCLLIFVLLRIPFSKKTD